VFDEKDVSWQFVSWEEMKEEGFLMIVCDKVQSEGLYLAHRHYQQQQQQQQPHQNTSLNMFPPCISNSASSNPQSPSHLSHNPVAYKILVAGRTVAITAPFSAMLPSASSSALAQPSPVVAYLAASCARSRDLPQLIALLTCDVDVFGAMDALHLLVDDDTATDGDEETEPEKSIINDEDKRWLLCAASAWAIDSMNSNDGQDSSSIGGPCSSADGNDDHGGIITACLQSSDILNDICALPLLSIEVRQHALRLSC
jgi:hypothetical protein